MPELKKTIRRSLGVCGSTSTYHLMAGTEEAAVIVGDVLYLYDAACGACIDRDVAKLRKEDDERRDTGPTKTH